MSWQLLEALAQVINVKEYEQQLFQNLRSKTTCRDNSRFLSLYSEFRSLMLLNPIFGEDFSL